MFSPLEIIIRYLFGHIGAALIRILSFGYYRPSRLDPSESTICEWFGLFGALFIGISLKELLY